MAWIELHQSLWTHRKTFLLADRLKIDETYAAAHLARFWTWALDNAPTGALDDVTPRVVAAASGWKGDPRALWVAMVESGWIEVDGDCHRIHDWHSYAGRLIEKREANAQRARTSRERRAHVAPLPNPTVPNQTPEAKASVAADAAEPAEQVAQIEQPEPVALAKRITPDFRAQMRIEFPELDEEAEYDRATNHIAYRKAIDKRRYYRNWLSNARKFAAEKGGPRANPRSHPQTSPAPYRPDARNVVRG